MEFIDIFAEEGAQPQPIDIEKTFVEIVDRYQNQQIEHDYSADQFVQDTETLMLDATFQDQLEVANAIAAQVHAMCTHDHSLADSVSQNELLGQHSLEDGHNHTDDYDETDPKKKKKRKKK